MAERTLIQVNPEKCVGCNACVRTCPAPEANITKMLDDGRFVTTVNYEKCIACGECVRNCSHGARDYLDDTQEALDKLKSGQRFIVLAAPAIKSVFPTEWKSILNWFKDKGCEVFDVAFGADICTWAHLRAVQRGSVGNIISQPCAAIVRYIEIYQPSLIKNLAPIHSPMLCAVTYIRKYMKRTDPILMLSPCIAKKNEFLETQMVDYNVTFKKLKQYFKDNGIKIPQNSEEDFKYDFAGMQGQVGGIYPRAGGLRDNLWLHEPDINITTSEGVHKVYPELDMYAELVESQKPKVFDVLSCEFGCNVGAGTDSSKTIFEVMQTMREVEAEAKKRRKTTGGLFFRGAEDKLFKQFDSELNANDFVRSYVNRNNSRTFSKYTLESAFNSMGKHTEEERNYNCHACGYSSCLQMATAIQMGLNVPENCIVNAKRTLQEQHKELTEKHDRLSEITAECFELSEQLTKDAQSIVQNVTSINSSNEKTDTLAKKVSELISKLVILCEAKHNKQEGMTAEEMQVLAKLLKNTDLAFTELGQNVKSASAECASVNTRISEIMELTSAINDSLAQADDKASANTLNQDVITSENIAEYGKDKRVSDSVYFPDLPEPN